MRELKEGREKLITTMCELLTMIYEFAKKGGRDGYVIGSEDVRKGLEDREKYV